MKKPAPLSNALSERGEQVQQGQSCSLRAFLPCGFFCTGTQRDMCVQDVAKVTTEGRFFCLYTNTTSCLSWCFRAICMGKSFWSLPGPVSETLSVFSWGCWGLCRVGAKKRVYLQLNCIYEQGESCRGGEESPQCKPLGGLAHDPTTALWGRLRKIKLFSEGRADTCTPVTGNTPLTTWKVSSAT